MNNLTAFIFAILAGIFTTLEATINSNLGKTVTPKIATLHSLITGCVVIFIINLIKGSLHQYNKIIYVKPQLLIGGIFGAFIIYFITKTIPKLGIANTLTIVVASQVVSGLVIDILFLHQEDFNLSKFIGIALLLLGVYFIIK